MKHNRMLWRKCPPTDVIYRKQPTSRSRKSQGCVEMCNGQQLTGGAGVERRGGAVVGSIAGHLSPSARRFAVPRSSHYAAERCPLGQLFHDRPMACSASGERVCRIRSEVPPLLLSRPNHDAHSHPHCCRRLSIRNRARSRRHSLPPAASSHSVI